MGLQDKQWWKRLFMRPREETKGEQLKNYQAVIEFLEELDGDTRFLLTELRKLEELEKEREQATEGTILQVNLEAQVELLDKVLERYAFFQNDADMNGVRLKQNAEQLLEQAKKAGLKDVVEEKSRKVMWQFDW